MAERAPPPEAPCAPEPPGPKATERAPPVVPPGDERPERLLFAARREIAEELSIVGPTPVHLFDYLYWGDHNRSWVAVYAVEWDGAIRHQESEVAWGEYFTFEDLHAKLDEWTFVPDGLEIFEHYLTTLQ